MPLKHVVCAIIEKDGLFLIAQRPYGKSLGGKWEFPGGKIEINESEQEALRREIREELGVEIDIGIRLTPSTHDYPDFTVHLIPYLCRIISGDLFSHEHTALAWVDSESIITYDLAAADLPIIEDYRLQTKRKPGQPYLFPSLL